jgi:outer membrane protein
MHNTALMKWNCWCALRGTYIGVLRAMILYQTALAQEKAIERQMEQTKQRFDVGLIAITDVQESQATYDVRALKP